MNDPLQIWLNEQTKLNRTLVLVLDSLAEPNPVPVLYSAGLMQRSVQLYRRTQYADFAAISPWLALQDNVSASAFQALLADPERHWGWIGSMETPDLDALTQHWQARMVIEEEGNRSLFRFQDNRVIARCLASLTEPERPLLLGPMSSVLFWDERQWSSVDNPKPGSYHVPNPAPWLRTPESAERSRGILRDNLKRWLLVYHAEAAASLSETRNVSEWLEEQLDLLESWQWNTPEQRAFMLSLRLDPKCAEDVAWQPLPGETPQTHFARCQRVLDTELSRGHA